MNVHKDKINFTKEKGICFGCLKKHPSVLHIERQDKGTSSDQQSVSLLNVSPTLSQTCGHIGAGNDDTSIFPSWQLKLSARRAIKVCRHMHFWTLAVQEHSLLSLRISKRWLSSEWIAVSNPEILETLIQHSFTISLTPAKLDMEQCHI